MAKEEINSLIDDVMASNQKKAIQRVVPVKEKTNSEVQFSFYLEKELLKKIKLHALQEEESIKSIINKALENYLKTN